MKFTPTSTYDFLSKASAKELNWKYSVRVTSSLSASLTQNDWTDVTNRVDAIPDVTSRIEFEIGQFTCDSVSMTAHNIAFWSSSYFTSASMNDINKYFEMKIEMNLSLGTMTASDTAIVYNGFIDKDTVAYDEITDMVSFTANTCEYIGGNISAATVNTQYLTYAVAITGNGSASAALILPRIPGIYVYNCSSSDKALKPGVHKITYSPASTGQPTLQLDTGAAVIIPTASVTFSLYNSTSLPASDEAIDIIPVQYELISETGTYTDSIIQRAVGDKLPYQPYYGDNMQSMVTRSYHAIGIDNVVFVPSEQTMSSWEGSDRIVFLDIPPADFTVVGEKNSMATDGTYLYIPIGRKLYKRDVVGAYTLLGNMTSIDGDIIERMWYNARNNELLYFIRRSSASSYGGGVGYRPYDSGYWGRYFLNSNTYMEEPGELYADQFNWNAMDMIDYQFSPGKWKYGIGALTQGPGVGFGLYFITASTLFPSPGSPIIPCSPIEPAPQERVVDFAVSKHVYVDPSLGGSGFVALFRDNSVTNGTSSYWDTFVKADGTWTDPYQRITGGSPALATYNWTDDLIYGVRYELDAQNAITGQSIYWQHPTNGTSSVIMDIDPKASLDSVWTDNPSGYSYISFANPTDASLGTLVILGGEEIVNSQFGAKTIQAPYARLNNHTYGIDTLGRLYVLQNTFGMFLNTYDYTGTNVRDFLSMIMRAYNLVCIVSGKSAYVYRRAHPDGTPVTSSAAPLVITANKASDLKKTSNKVHDIQYVKLDNGTMTTTYNGSVFGGTTFGDAKVVSISNELIPASILKDIAYYIWQFFKQNRSTYKMSLGPYPMFQYEPLDGCQIVLPNQKIGTNTSGVIYSVTYKQDGTMDIEVLL